ncbi:uncharacterized protein LOC109601826 isoform X7 [Aethina tumida]|uniref:uncharacterized protein LOC109601826 isoform X7 n=1 Tax=Aethina tumida TaxID=116153 RepID=UPI0021494151|nr:uncharacterized protein LOC109601826 isoform X7 [Aethina tumida]
MKIYIFIALVALFAITNGVFVPPRPGHKKHLLGAKECTWGPGYWCQNITTSAACHATKHCIDTVWVHLQLPPDDSSVCQTCKDMVQQARDQLLSNDTQELIKEVFEGSCALLHIKPIVKECDKIADEYIPELIDTLASQMNPQVVCSVAGLCNSAKIQKMLADSKLNSADDKTIAPVNPDKSDPCEGCHSVVKVMETKFNQMSRDDVLQAFLHVCGKLSTLSDACSNIVLTYFTEIYQHIQQNFNPTDVCLMAGECSAQFHTHNIEITPMSHVGYVYPKGDDLPCDLCEQLVGHLRDLLVANTTESEFKRVLEGLCKQTKSFANECLSIVDEYYSVIYSYLVNEMKPKEMCTLINICPRSEGDKVDIKPLVPIETAQAANQQGPLPKQPLVHINIGGGQLDARPETAQLPIELLMPPHIQNIYSKETCLFCEYFLHFVQESITDPKTEASIKTIIDGACERLPPSINSTCVQFVDMYEPAMIALLAQEIDPSVVCPLIKACPNSNSSQDVEVFMEQENDSPKCPLCLYAVSKLESMVKDKKTEDNIRANLKKLCKHLPGSLAPECNDFVETYTNELVEMLMADLQPNEVCIYIKLCPDDSPKVASNNVMPIIDIDANFAAVGGDIRTNIIPDDTINGQSLDAAGSKPQCVMCEFVMKEIEDQLKDNKTEEEIKNIVYGICKIMPKSVRPECQDFVNTYADTVIQLLIQALEPSQICSMIHLCQDKYMTILQGEIMECAVCEGALEAMVKILNNPKADHAVEHVLEKTCRALPKKFRNQCNKLVKEKGIHLYKGIKENKNKEDICNSFKQCISQLLSTFRSKRSQVGTNVCTRGPGYWCQNEQTANECNTLEICRTRYWNTRSKRSPQYGANVCTRGPGYWCQNEQTANECNTLELCRTRYWNSRSKRSPQYGANVCTRGPGYWCQNERTANECNTLELCRTRYWNTKSKRSPQFGANVCTRGPGYWCQNEQTANECNTLQLCRTRYWNTRSKRSPQYGANVCTRGPGYWCQNERTANECNTLELCRTRYWNTKSKRSPQFGANVCTRGPGYWCQNEQTANECNTLQLCRTRYWNTRSKRSPQYGANVCTRGPGYWCQNERTANECNTLELCRTRYWNTKSKRSPQFGANVCTRGPGYWCQNEQTANECNTLQLCRTRYWNSRSKRSPQYGANVCTRGPGYWCQNEQTANECNTLEVCRTRYWNSRSKRSPQYGVNVCTRGPGYWCQNEQTAKECNTLEICRTRYWKTK